MGDISSILNLSKDALLAQLSAINITGSNIANINTPGYSRQVAVFSSTGTVQNGDMQLGVQVTNAERIYDKYLNAQIVDQQQASGFSDTEKSYFDQIGNIFNESTTGGLSDEMGQFWSAWQNLSANPTGTAERQVLVSVSQNLASQFNDKANQLSQVAQDADASVADMVNKVNGLTSDIANYNEQIASITQGGGSASSLLDQRDESLQQLSQLVNVQTVDDSSGAVDVFLANGQGLVEDNQNYDLAVRTDPSNSNYNDVVFNNSEQSLDSIITGGQIGAALDIRDNIVPGYMASLNNMANTFVNTVNAQHALGYDSYGNSGGSFFVDSSGGAASMQVSSAIIADPGKIAASATVNNDGDNAQSIANIENSLVMSGNTATLGGFYSSLVGKIGQDSQNADSVSDRQDTILSQLQNQRDSVSGVSLEEEMMNLIQYQMGYNAAGKLSATVSEMMDTLMSLVKTS